MDNYKIVAMVIASVIGGALGLLLAYSKDHPIKVNTATKIIIGPFVFCLFVLIDGLLGARMDEISVSSFLLTIIGVLWAISFIKIKQSGQ